MEDDQSNEKHL